MGWSGTDGDHAIPERPAAPQRLGDGYGYEAFVPNGAVGRGGNATVYEASLRDDPDRVVALKEPHVSDAVPGTVRERFRSETETWAALDDHPHVVTVHAGATDPHPWIALEYMDAGNLADRADGCGLDQGLWIGACVAAALDHAHRNGVAHLDLKPENVLFRDTPGDAWPIPKVADWGMARSLRSGTVNLEGLSPRYAAPEQFAPDRYGPPGASTDVYQLGVVLYELLVGTVPFDGPPRVLRDAVLDETPPPPSGRNPDLPASVDDLLDRALAKEPAERYDSMFAFRCELERLFAARTGFEPEGGAGSVLVDGTDAPSEPPAGQVGVSEEAASTATSPYERALKLANEGFVQLSEGYFARREPAPLLEAWRRGVRLVDAHAGRAVERSVSPDGDDTERISLTDRLLDGLGDGTDHVVLGAPGSGKSTVCKQVACEWFDRGRGPVFYRESGTGTRFERSDALARRVTDVDGHALVVVEDAVRPEATAVFEFLDRVGDQAEVTLLLDAREAEWREAGRGSDAFGTDPVTEGREALEPIYVPRPDRYEHERFVRVAEAATDRSLDVDVEQLRGGVQRAAAGESDGDETQPGELFYLLHRLTALARDPLAEGTAATTLTDTVGEVYDRLADAGEGALDVGVCANVCNAAGIGVHPELLYAVVPEDPLAVDDALDVLDGRVVFPREADWSDGSRAYPAIHEAWSPEFLAHWLDAAGHDAARERFGRVLTRLLSLADDETAREQAAGTIQGTAPYLARIERDPAAWADETVEAVFGLAEAYPRLAPLFGTTETAAYELPESCSSARRRDVILTRGDAHRGASEYDRARSEYETARQRARSADDRTRVAASLDGLGTVARLVNDFDEAREHYRESLEIAREIGDRRLEAEILNHLGMNATRRDEYDRAQGYVERSLEVARDLDDRLGVARCLHTLGTIATRQGDPERARERLEPSLEIKRELGDRPGVARSLNRLGTAAQKRGEHEQARDYFQRSLEIWRELGNRWWVAALLHNIGMVETVQENYERARECHRRALEINQELSVPHGVAMNFSKLGMVAERQNEYEEAREHHRRSLEIFRDLGKPQDLAYALQYLGTTARGLGNLATARDYLDRSLEKHRDVGDDHGRAECLQELGTLAHRRENHDEARAFYEAAAELFAEIGDGRQELEVLENLVELEREAGRDDRAREHCETARQRLDDAAVPGELREAIELLCDVVESEQGT